MDFLRGGGPSAARLKTQGWEGCVSQPGSGGECVCFLVFYLIRRSLRVGCACLLNFLMASLFMMYG